VYEKRRRILARVLAATICVMAGDTIRGRRALSREFDPTGCFVRAIDSNGIAEGAVPEAFRGYARLCNAAFVAAARTKSPLGLTPAETEVLRALTTGATVRTIATGLGKSEKTVQRQVESIYRKLHVSNRVQAVHRAREFGITDPVEKPV
jgi:DNA-binding NarL/FixJ family response regulator